MDELTLYKPKEVSPEYLVCTKKYLIKKLLESNLSLKGFKLLFIAIATITKNTTSFEPLIFSVRHLAELIGIDKSDNFYREIRVAVNELKALKVTVENKNSSKFRTTFLDTAIYDSGKVILKFNPFCSQALLNVTVDPSMPFTLFKLRDVLELRSINSLRLFLELITRLFKVPIKVQYGISEIRKVFSLEKSSLYSRLAHLNYRILKPSIKEIIKRTELKVSLELVRAGRRVLALNFLIFYKLKRDK